MSPTEALNRLGKLALFPPGATIPGSSATATNVLLRAARALRGESYSGEQSLPLELDALRANLAQRQELLRSILAALDDRGAT